MDRHAAVPKGAAHLRLVYARSMTLVFPDPDTPERRSLAEAHSLCQTLSISLPKWTLCRVSEETLAISERKGILTGEYSRYGDRRELLRLDFNERQMGSVCVCDKDLSVSPSAVPLSRESCSRTRRIIEASSWVSLFLATYLMH